MQQLMKKPSLTSQSGQKTSKATLGLQVKILNSRNLFGVGSSQPCKPMSQKLSKSSAKVSSLKAFYCILTLFPIPLQSTVGQNLSSESFKSLHYL